jgi:hypothetical protein
MSDLPWFHGKISGTDVYICENPRNDKVVVHSYDNRVYKGGIDACLAVIENP